MIIGLVGDGGGDSDWTNDRRQETRRCATTVARGRRSLPARSALQRIVAAQLMLMLLLLLLLNAVPMMTKILVYCASLWHQLIR